LHPLQEIDLKELLFIVLYPPGQSLSRQKPISSYILAGSVCGYQLMEALTVADVVGAIKYRLLHMKTFYVKTADPIYKDDFLCGFYIHLLF
jgi:hypothetical protein